MGKTLFDKIWDAHVVGDTGGGSSILYIDRHYCHEVTSPQAFDGLRARKTIVFRQGNTVCSPDHNIPTTNQDKPILDTVSRHQVDTLRKNAKDFGLRIFDIGDSHNGIIHVIGPENGLTLPGQTVICGDSHTSTHGAMGCIAFGVGTSEVEMVLATQSLLQQKPKTMRINVEGQLGECVTAKDMALYIIAKLGTGGATGYFVEYAGSAVRSLSMEGRMTLCNMSIEMGARGGMVAPDDTTFEYIRGKEFAPSGLDLESKIANWKTLPSDPDAKFDREETFDAADIKPRITFGTNPGMGIAIDECIPDVPDEPNAASSFKKSLEYMGFKPGEKLLGKKIDYVFLGSCTNGRIEDFRAFAQVVKGKKKAGDVVAWLVPGSRKVRRQIEEEGIDRILEDAGFELRDPGCSACLAMNEDKVPEGKLCISTSNRNFEGRQGPGSRTILASPLVAAASAITGQLADPRTFTEPEKIKNEKFSVVRSRCIPLPVENIDTDQIIPARFLKSTKREGFGENLFRDWRYDADGSLNKDFVLNNPKYSGCILVAGKNFGCGSSREHAAWAIADYGFRVVISSFFADIHRNNELNNFVLPVTVSQAFLDSLLASIDKDPTTEVTVDLPSQTVTNETTGESEHFEINAYKKLCLEQGLDDIDYLFTRLSDIEEYETKNSSTAG